MTKNQESIVAYSVDRAARGIDFAETWYLGLLRFERAYFANIEEFLFLCALKFDPPPAFCNHGYRGNPDVCVDCQAVR